jgi:hypothetical protein
VEASSNALVHPEGARTGASPYYTKTFLTELVLRDLLWWQTFLSILGRRAARSARSAILMLKWAMVVVVVLVKFSVGVGL